MENVKTLKFMCRTEGRMVPGRREECSFLKQSPGKKINEVCCQGLIPNISIIHGGKADAKLDPSTIRGIATVSLLHSFIPIHWVIFSTVGHALPYSHCRRIWSSFACDVYFVTWNNHNYITNHHCW
ncbi:Hypothetical predicted protein [Olea europaea subsp. europaea]|uniref:Uncharacterized protein n=1 Tax=Olea europaea subsp. europaea TaxID=158383 RepID=A0A8S0S2M9_OLEEU|nr:Hypothetical predicted protein [Olea europaea subsp. europaea]